MAMVSFYNGGEGLSSVKRQDGNEGGDFEAISVVVDRGYFSFRVC